MHRSAVVSLILLLSAVFSRAQALNQDPAAAQIEGTVASATNGKLLARARVVLHRMAQKDNYVTWIDADDYGHFLFKNVEEGPYEILAEKAGFFTDPHKSATPALDLKLGDHVRGIVVRLMPLSVIRGRIVNEHDDLVQDTQVRLLAKEYHQGRELLNPVGFAVTDDRGEYRLFGIRPGNYYLVVEYDVKKARPIPFPGVPVRDAPPEASYPPLFYPLTSDLRQAQRISVTPGAENGDKTLPRRISVEFTPLVKSTGAFRVTAQLRVRPGETGNKYVLEFTAKLHPGDRYSVSLPSLPQDYYLKSILVDGHEVSASDVAIHGNNSELVLVAAPGGGHIEGIVRNSRGQPLAGHVILVPDVYRPAPEQVRSVHADAQGRFTLRGVPPGSYKLYAWEELDLNELFGQLDLLKNFEAECQVVHVDENGAYNPELTTIAAR